MAQQAQPGLLPSIRSAPADPTDNQLVPPGNYKELTPNNKFFDFDHFDCNEWNVLPVLIMQRHPLRYALSAHVDVPEIYLQQFWSSMQLDRNDVGRECLSARIDAYSVVLTRARIRAVLRLPGPPADGYANMPPLNVMVDTIRANGYIGPTELVSSFLLKYFPQTWRAFWLAIEHCLTSSTRSVDKLSISAFNMFYALTQDIHIDYAHELFQEIKQSIAQKRNPKKNKWYQSVEINLNGAPKWPRSYPIYFTGNFELYLILCLLRMASEHSVQDPHL